MFIYGHLAAKRCFTWVVLTLALLTCAAVGPAPACAWSEQVVDNCTTFAHRSPEQGQYWVRDPRTGVVIWFDCTPASNLAL
jgi:hypothetical protein